MSDLGGVGDFRDYLKGLDRSVQAGLLDAVAKGSKVVSDAVAARARVRSGKLKGSVRPRKVTRKGDRYAGGVVISGGHDTPMVAAVEFGTQEQPAHPFIRPGFDKSQSKAIGAIEGEIGRAIDRADG